MAQETTESLAAINVEAKADTLFEGSHQVPNELEQASNTAINGAKDSLKSVNKAYSKEQNALDSLSRLLNAPADKISNMAQKINSLAGDGLAALAEKMSAPEIVAYYCIFKVSCIGLPFSCSQKWWDDLFAL